MIFGKKFLILSMLIAGAWAWGFSSSSVKPPLAEEGLEPIIITKIEETIIEAANPLPEIYAASSTEKIVKAATTTQKKKIATTSPIEIAAKPIADLVIPPSAPIPVEVEPDFTQINTFARKAIVNILCSVKGGEMSPMSGTGIVVSPDGIILTNAHVAQYYLLRDYYEKDFIDCIIRTGNPAYPTYRAELIHISPKWVEENKAILREASPKGTGEYDFAFLRITGKIDGGPVGKLPYLEPNTNDASPIKEPVVLVSYPAGFLGGMSILQSLYVTSGVTDVRDVFTFGSGGIDIISVPGTVVSQKGSSGGAVVDRNSSVIGIIVTSTDEKTTGNRDLHALTLSYINRRLHTETSYSVSEFLKIDLQNYGRVFRETKAPALTKLIQDELDR